MSKNGNLRTRLRVDNVCRKMLIYKTDRFFFNITHLPQCVDVPGVQLNQRV